MNVDRLLSDHLKELRRTVATVLQRSSLTGRAVPFGEARQITDKINTAVALAQEVEEENRILEHRLSAGRDDLRNRKAAADITDVASGDNVTAFRALSPKI
ncbi:MULTISPECIES: hypothetical protein [unclassified Shinella]|uniref:hypothetical protein n=1 Tax=unclassified Shinella TaxID=2643062 RepID=UPI00225CED93|nr:MULTISPECIES: hypothetical protein [unclassified Shinella]MCO5139027.1 hypothetical protein [Shinella sp.]MDC7256244.1 hypothetical protein [Shinella sp. YE25]CAI0339101.1 hypothetical protein SHINE37_42955 [Rhizobiaceae bacterium]CAK7257517.1 protein of unknown function [Shinella sp. WSC3-e]